MSTLKKILLYIFILIVWINCIGKEDLDKNVGLEKMLTLIIFENASIQTEKSA